MELTKARLGLFGDPGVFLLKDQKEAKSAVKRDKYYSIESAKSINNNGVFGLFFTPNGNYGKINTPGETLERKGQDAENYIAAFFVDIDLKFSDKKGEEHGMDMLLEEIMEVIKETGLKVGYIVRTGAGYHLYIFVDPSERDIFGMTYLSGPRNLKAISDIFANMFNGGDHAAGTINKLMRVPFSKYWKKGDGRELDLYRVSHNNGITLKKVFEVKDIVPPVTIGFMELEQILDNCELGTGEALKELPPDIDVTIKKLRMPDVLDRLEKRWPRIYGGKKQTLKLRGNKISIINDGVEEVTDGYRLNIKENYINNFSTEAHGIDERPMGGVYSFLTHYFKGSIADLDKFLQKEYGFGVSPTATTVHRSLPTLDGFLEYTSEGVNYVKTDPSKKKNVTSTTVVVPGMFPVSANKAVLQDRDGLDIAEYSFNFEIVRTGEVFTIRDFVNADQFNKNFAGQGISMVKRDAREPFYHALFSAVHEGTLPLIEELRLNGRYKDFYIMGKRVYNKEGRKIDLSNQAKLAKAPEVKQKDKVGDGTTLRIIGNTLLKLNAQRPIILSFLTFIMLMCTGEFRKDVMRDLDGQFIFPGLFFAGATKTGKTTLINLYKSLFGLDEDAKKMSVKGTTPQPLRQAASDNFILHLEEYTGKIRPDLQGIIRDIINRSITKRGKIDGTNETYAYKSGLIIDGEQYPDEESVANRLVIIYMSSQELIQDRETLTLLHNKNVIEDFITNLYAIDKETISEYYHRGLELLDDITRGPRERKIYTLLFIVNEMFNVYDQKMFLEAVKKNVLLLADTSADIDPIDRILNNVAATQKIKVTLNTLEEDHDILMIPIPTENSGGIGVDITRSLQMYPDNVKRDGSHLKITYPKETSQIPLDEKTIDLIKIIEKYNTFYYNNF